MVENAVEEFSPPNAVAVKNSMQDIAPRTSGTDLSRKKPYQSVPGSVLRQRPGESPLLDSHCRRYPCLWFDDDSIRDTDNMQRKICTPLDKTRSLRVRLV